MLLFMDESGTDHAESPYEVLAGVAIQSRDLWNLIQAVRATEREVFGMTLAEARVEFKGRKLLKPRVFRFASQSYPLPQAQRVDFCREFLKKGCREEETGAPQGRCRNEFTAYGQACLEFVERVLALCSQYRAKVFALMVLPEAAESADTDRLRRDYFVLFRRFGHYVEETGADRMGLIIFDERDKAHSQCLCQKMDSYFLGTGEGRALSAHIVPEPFFVHSDLTTAVRLADIVAYILNWGFRLPTMTKPRREEIRPLADMVYGLSYKGVHLMEDGSTRTLYGISYLDDLSVGTRETADA